MARGPVTRRALLRLAAGGAVAAAGLRSALADCVFPVDARLSFRVRHGDEVIGRHALDFSRALGDFVVRADTSYEVRLGNAPPRVFEQHLEETWREGWLHALVSDTAIDAARWSVRAERKADGILAGRANGQRFTVSGYAITSALWHRDTPAQGALLDVVDGHVRLIKGYLVGEETLELRGQARATKHFAIRGEINRDLWYDADCRLVRITAPLSDGSQLVFEIG